MSKTRTMMFAGAAMASLGVSAPRVRRGPAPEKYPGQRQAFRKGAWGGDGVKPDRETRQMRRAGERAMGVVKPEPFRFKRGVLKLSRHLDRQEELAERRVAARFSKEPTS